MKPLYRIFTLLVLASFILGACGQTTPTTAPIQPTRTSTASTLPPTQPTLTTEPTQSLADDVLYLNITWHQHQPLYYKDDNGIYTRPWVRVHATKDYYDMAATVAKYPDVHVTFNLTPVLIKQLNDFVQNGAKDQYWVLSEKPASDLTVEDKDFILRRFFDANWDNMIRAHPGYKRLLDLRGGTTDADIQNAMQTFTEQDFRDLQIWFNLVWMDPDLLAVDPLKALVTKDHDFEETDKTVVFDVVRKVMAEVLPIHKQLQDQGQIEVITTPYAHPILPLLYDTNLAAIGNPQAELPKRFSYVQDVIAQLDKSVEIYKDTYGVEPRGMWPGEGAVAQQIVPFVGRAGYTWMASGEQVLANSLGIGSFTRDAKDTVQEADQLYRPYFVEGPADGPVKGPPVMMVFRDLLLSDKIGFTYSQTPGQQAADDFMQRLEDIRARLKDEGSTGPHLVSVILDGENAWENYPNDGKEFLNALYQDLSTSKTIKTVTPSEYLKMFPEQQKLDTLFPGAWFSPNYDTWIGEPEETSAWNYLGKVRKFLQDYELNKKQAPSPEALAQAFDYMYLAEGSDWFWWYGADQDSGNDAYFDEGYRALLAKVYESLGEPVPSFVKVPIIPEKVVETTQQFSGVFTPTIDGVGNPTEWDKAAYYPFVGGAQARSEDVASGFYYGVDGKNLYLRVDAKADWSTLKNGVVGIYVASPKIQFTYSTSRLTQSADDPYLLGFAATTLAEVDLTTGNGAVYSALPTGWNQVPDTEIKTAVKKTTLEVAIPLSTLGDVQAGDELKFVAVVSSGDRDLQSLPASGPGQLILPDLGNIDYFINVTDPTGDDHGPGAYTYPTDAVFEQGVFDITSFKVGMSDTDVVFNFTFAGEIKNPWGSGNNFSVETMDVYIDKDPGAGTGARLMLPGRNASLEKSDGWDFAIWAEGWTPGIFAPDPSTLEPKPVSGASYKIIVDPATSTITLRVPRSFLGDGDPTQWGYAAIVLSQDGYPAPGVWRVRDVSPTAEQWRVGGAPEDTNHTRILDLVWDGTAPTQEEMLSSYPGSQADVDTLKPDDFAQVKLLLAK